MNSLYKTEKNCILNNESLHDIDKIMLRPSNHIRNISEKSVANCLICFDKTPDCVFMDCGHGGKFIIFYFFLLFLTTKYKTK